MSARKKIEKDIDGYKTANSDIDNQIEALKAEKAANDAAIDALEKALKYIPKDDEDEKPAQLRYGSDMARAREVILQKGKPLYIMDLLDALGKEQTKKNKLSVAGSISSYVRNGQFFTRPAPNTFGVVEFEQQKEKNNGTGEENLMDMLE